MNNYATRKKIVLKKMPGPGKKNRRPYYMTDDRLSFGAKSLLSAMHSASKKDHCFNIRDMQKLGLSEAEAKEQIDVLIITGGITPVDGQFTGEQKKYRLNTEIFK
jgi:hypothetical protein